MTNHLLTRDSNSTYGILGILWLVLVSLSLMLGGCSETGERPPEVLIVQDKPAEWADALKLGFLDGLAASGFEQGTDFIIVHHSAAGDAQSLTSIAQGIRGRRSALVFTLGTQASQTVFNAVKDKPLIFGAVTDPVRAGFFDGSLDKPIGNITGTQDVWPYEAQLDLIQRLLPQIRKIGVPGNLSEINTQVSLEHIRRVADSRGIEILEKPVSNQAEVGPATAALLSTPVDAIFIPADNTVQTNAPTIIAAGNAKRIPVFTGISGIVENGALATVGTNYYELGRVNGEMAARVLAGEEARLIPVSVARRGDIYINLRTARQIGIEIPTDILDAAFRIYE